ncbi:fatty acid-binding protein, intestinal [Rhinoraja longicauda]
MTFNGTWKVDRNENYDKFMEQMGVNIVKRKLALHDNLKIIIHQDGQNFTVKESSTFRTKDIEFTLGVSFEYSLADGSDLQGSWNLDGNKLVGKFTKKDTNKDLLTDREIVGNELVQTYSYEGVDAKRFFKKE